MSLGQKTFAIIFLTVIGITAALYPTTRALMLRSFLRLEEDQMRSAVRQARSALDSDISNLAATTNDYAAWDRTYKFMQHRSSIYIGQEMANDTLDGLTINLVLLLDKNNRIVFIKKFDTLNGQDIEVPMDERLALAADPWIQRAQLASGPASGIMALAKGPVLIAACPILTTERKGPAEGVLVMMRNLDAARIAHLRASAGYSLTIVPYSRPQAPDSDAPGILVEAVNADAIRGSEILTDIRGEPILDLRLQQPRPVFHQGLHSLHYFLAALCLASLAFGAASWVSLRLAVISRVVRLSAQVSKIGEQKTPSERVVVGGDDEIGWLGKEINNMLAALQNSDLQFRNIADNIHQVFWVKDAATQKMEYLSLAYETLWGRPREEVYQNPHAWIAGVFPDDLKTVGEMLQQQSRGKIGSAEFRVLRPDGTLRWICNRYFPVLDEEGKLHKITGLAENINESKLAQEVLRRSQEDLEHLVQERTAELAQANEALREKQELFRQLFAAIPVPVWVCNDRTHRFLEVNDAAIAHYGYSREEFLRLRLEDIRTPESAHELETDLAQLQPQGAVYRMRKHRLKDGRVIDVEVSLQRAHFTGEPTLLSVSFDVTERQRMEVELRHGQKLQAVGELAAGIAHEINTPIQFVGNNAEFLQKAFPNLLELLEKHEKVYSLLQGQCPAELADELKTAAQAADLGFLRQEIPAALAQTLVGIERVSSIVQALKKFSHVDWGPEKSPADLNDAVKSTLTIARNEWKYVAEVETVYGDLPSVPCHLGDLNQVILNLLVNAAHAIGDVFEKTGQRGRIHVETKVEDSWAVIAISDTGTGIPEEIRGRIFEPFFTTKDVGKGTGQGLALARAIIVEKHGGTLTFETAIGKGTTFYIRIPLTVAPATEEEMAIER